MAAASTCAARTEEAVGATWGEIDLQTGFWTIPSGRMKAAKDHVVPLSEAALEILKGLPRDSAGEFVFPGVRSGEPLGPTIMLRRLRDMRPGVTVHGSVRSGFKDWASETDASDEFVVEAALGHAIPNAVERAYRRGRLLERRRQLMSRWAAFLAGEAPNVVTMRDAQAR